MMTKRCREEVEFDSINQADVLMQLSRGGDDASTPGRRVFECKTCGRRFTSFQALGGHRASHKKPKVSGDDDRAGQMTAAKPKTHECSVCGQEFAMGQALGGHMRRHRASAEGLICHGFVEKNPSLGKRVLLDLNFPPMEEEGESRIFGMAPMIQVRYLRDTQIAAEEKVVPHIVEKVILKEEIDVKEELLLHTIKEEAIPKAEIDVKEELIPEGSGIGSSSHPAPIADLDHLNPDYA